MSDYPSKGQHVVCIDGFFAPEIAKLYNQLPVEGVEYVIRDWWIGGNYDDGKRDEVQCVVLVGLSNPAPIRERAMERGFNAKRFLPLDELTDENKQTRKEVVFI